MILSFIFLSLQTLKINNFTQRINRKAAELGIALDARDVSFVKDEVQTAVDFEFENQLEKYIKRIRVLKTRTRR